MMYILDALVGIDNSILQVDLVCGSAAAWFIGWTEGALATALSWCQHRKHCPYYYYHYYHFTAQLTQLKICIFTAVGRPTTINRYSTFLQTFLLTVTRTVTRQSQSHSIRHICLSVRPSVSRRKLTCHWPSSLYRTLHAQHVRRLSRAVTLRRLFPIFVLLKRIIYCRAAVVFQRQCCFLSHAFVRCNHCSRFLFCHHFTYIIS